MTAKLPDTIQGVDLALSYYVLARARYTPAVPVEVRETDRRRVDELLEWRLMLQAVEVLDEESA